MLDLVLRCWGPNDFGLWVELEDSSEVKGERAEDNSNVSGDIRDIFCDGPLLQKKLKVLKSF